MDLEILEKLVQKLLEKAVATDTVICVGSCSHGL